MVWLAKHSRDEAAGALIAELLEIKATTKLYVYANTWLLKFPYQHSAPSVIGAWLTGSDSTEAARFAAHYLSLNSLCDDLRPIIRATFVTKRRKKLCYLIDQLLEHNPKSMVWSGCFYFDRIKRQPRLEKLALRWLTLNMNNKNIFPMGLAFSRSPKILEQLFQWLNTTGRKSSMMSDTLFLLLYAARRYKPLRPKLANFARDWLSVNPNHSNAGYMYGELIRLTKQDSDIQNALLWYGSNELNQSAYMVLRELLAVSRSNGTAPDAYVIEQAKTILANQSPKDRHSELLYELIQTNADQDTIRLAKEACAQEYNW